MYITRAPITFSHIIWCPGPHFPSPRVPVSSVHSGPGHSSIALSLASGEEFLLGDLFEHFESVRDKDGGYPLLVITGQAGWGVTLQCPVCTTPLLSGFKKTKLKHGAVCLTSLVFRHLRFGESLARTPLVSPGSMSYSAGAELVTICRGSLPRSLHGKIEFNGRMALSTRINQMSSSKLWPSLGIVLRVGTDDNPTKPFSKVGNSNFRTTGDGWGGGRAVLCRYSS